MNINNPILLFISEMQIKPTVNYHLTSEMDSLKMMRDILSGVWMKKKLPGDGSRGINTASIENNGEGPQKSKNKTSINLTAVYGAKENDISLPNCSHCKTVKYSQFSRYRAKLNAGNKWINEDTLTMGYYLVLKEAVTLSL